MYCLSKTLHYVLLILIVQIEIGLLKTKGGDLILLRIHKISYDYPIDNFTRRPVKKPVTHFTQSPHLLMSRLSYRRLENFRKNYRFVKYQANLISKTSCKLYILKWLIFMEISFCRINSWSSYCFLKDLKKCYQFCCTGLLCSNVTAKMWLLLCEI